MATPALITTAMITMTRVEASPVGGVWRATAATGYGLRGRGAGFVVGRAGADGDGDTAGAGAGTGAGIAGRAGRGRGAT
ncbi:hypothetical protein, partial [Actinomadura harenae]|uniref:hypothetical protein n=1 Tax=Actinomadura harenae TaxID=2483351 RepID=UPI002277B8F1